MPRFSAFDEDSSSLAQRGFESPVGRFQSPSADGFLSSPAAFGRPRKQSTVRLVCTSPDGSSYHTLIKSRVIETAFINPGEQPNGDTIPQKVRTTLPEFVQAALQIDPALELLCVEGEMKNHRESQKILPRLVLYTAKSAFLLKLSYQESSDATEIAGEVISADQPFQAYLERSYSSEILRIRPAPQQRDGYVTMCPGASMAALVLDKDIQEYTLLLHHGAEGKITIPLVFGMEETAEPAREQILDFTFAQSKGLSAFSSLSVVMVKGSGDLYSASPIVFDGTIFPVRYLTEALDYLRAVLDAKQLGSPEGRRARAAQQFFLDVFERRNQFATARLQIQVPQSAGNWPVRLQGPVLFNNDGGAFAGVLQNFGNSPNLVGLAVGKWNYAVDIAVLSPTCLVPRFSLESQADAWDLDEIVCKLGRWVEKAELSKSNKQSLALELKKDPLNDSLLHVVTPHAIFTLSTNALRSLGRTQPARTTAWSSVQANSEQSLVLGVSIPSEEDGHLMSVRQADGSTTAVKVTELQLKHELDTRFQAPLAGDKGSTAGSTALVSLESTPTLCDSIQDLVHKVQNGLGGLRKIVGSETKYTDITPDTLAVAMGVKERCDAELVLPLLELQKIVSARREKLQEVADDQRRQITDLQKLATELKERQQTSYAQIETIGSNAAILQERAKDALEQATGLFPQVTQAEYAYFQDMKRLKNKCDLMESEWKELKKKISSQSDTIQEAHIDDSIKNFDPSVAEKANALLDHGAVELKMMRNRLKKVDERVGNVARASA